VRSRVPAATLIPLLQRAVVSVDPEIPVAGTSPQNQFRAFDTYLDALLANQRLTAWSVAAFGAATLVLAAVGVFGLMAYAVVRRTREMGLRLALGASPRAVRGLVLRHALALSAGGIALGLTGAAAGSRLVRAQLFGIGTTDPAVYVGTALLFLVVTVAAGLVPAWRASRVDPITMLRTD
jgi:putative ABC transport system permease protein